MSNQRYNFQIPNELDSKLEEKINKNGYQSKAEYLRGLIRQDVSNNE